MIEIKHRFTGEVLLRIDADTLVDANLRLAYLLGANLRGTNMHGSQLFGAQLLEADLSGANLFEVNLAEADLQGAVLYGADLTNADLSGANLRGADLRGAFLFQTNLSRANLSEADFDGAHFANTVINRCVDLHNAKKLETIEHFGSGILDTETLRANIEYLPDVFLEGVGFTRDEIDYFRALYRESAIEYYSCFISYSHKNEDFARMLHSRLRDANIRVWYAPKEMKGGRKLYEQIDDAIRIHDKLLIVLSENSLNSEWVKTEIRKARKQEVKEGKRKLFPIALVPFSPAIKDWECFDADTGKDLGVELREYYIPDFSDWKDHDTFEAEFAKLHEALKASEAKPPA